MTLASILLALLLGTAATAATDPSPAPSTPATPTKQLREIGRVRVTVCGNIVVHANGAISSTLRNDATLARTVDRLRKADLESNPLAYQHGISDLDRLAGQLRDDAVRGAGEVQRLRDLAKQAKDPARKADLQAFADALGGALYRQKKAATDLNGFIAYLYARDMRSTPANDQMIQATKMDMGPLSPNYTPRTSVLTWHEDTPNQMAAAAADDFQQREHEILADEGTAADHAEGAVSGCSQ
jgi:hypothetical protein